MIHFVNTSQTIADTCGDFYSSSFKIFWVSACMTNTGGKGALSPPQSHRIPTSIYCFTLRAQNWSPSRLCCRFEISLKKTLGYMSSCYSPEFVLSVCCPFGDCGMHWIPRKLIILGDSLDDGSWKRKEREKTRGVPQQPISNRDEFLRGRTGNRWIQASNS